MRRSNMTMIIIGAGLAGLMAGALDRRAHIFEKQSVVPHNHRAVLRFRDDKIARALDIPFRKVRVLKAVNRSLGPIADANAYSKKVTGRIAPRSVMALDPVDRFIAPEDFIPRLVELVESRLTLSTELDGEWLFDTKQHPILSTIPLPVMLRMAHIAHSREDFTFSSVRVFKFRVPNCDSFQTIYYPYADNLFYRASLTGNELLLESMDNNLSESAFNTSIERVLTDFQIEDAQPIAVDTQALGKIVPLPDAQRKALLMQLTVEHKVFSLGRYACWRNILLDDVFEDYYRVKKLMAMDNHYDFKRALT